MEIREKKLSEEVPTTWPGACQWRSHGRHSVESICGELPYGGCGVCKKKSQRADEKDCKLGGTVNSSSRLAQRGLGLGSESSRSREASRSWAHWNGAGPLVCLH